MPKPELTSAAEIAAGNERVLFVEGHDELSFDPHALSALLGASDVHVIPVGGCENVMAAVHALSWEGAPQQVIEGAEFYSVIDRDHLPNAEVEPLWTDGPLARGPHLVWRRHEFENYFLEPEFITQSEYFRGGKAGVAGLQQSLVKAASARVFLDAANLVIKELRSAWQRWDPRLAEFQPSEAPFDDAASAEAALLGGRPYATVLEDAAATLSPEWLRGRLHDNLAMLFGTTKFGRLRAGKGEWHQRMEGSGLLGAVLSPRFFRIPASDGKPLQGKPLMRHIAAELLRRFDELPVKPQDFVELRDYFRRTQRLQFPSP